MPRPKPLLKIRTATAIFWNYLGIFRDYGLKNILFRNKTFSFFKVESWNFQHLFEIGFRETSQVKSFSLFRQLLFSIFLSVFWLKFCEVSRNSFRNWSLFAVIQPKIHNTDKRTDLWSRDFIIWKINSGLWSGLDCEIIGSGLMSNFWDLSF